MRPIRLFCALLALTLVPAAAGCSRCGGERSSASRDAGAASKRSRKDRRRVRDGGTEARPAREPRPILPEARLSAVEGQVSVDTTTRVQMPRRRLADGGVQVEPLDGGATGGVQAARDGFEMQIGDTLRTGTDGSVDLELPEQQGSLSVGPESTLRVSRHAVNEWAIVRGRVRAALQTPGRGRRVLKLATPSALATIVGNEAVVAVADDGAVRVYALAGTAKVRAASPRDEIEIPEHQMLEVSLDGTAGRPEAITGDAVASADEWRNGRHAIVARDPAPTLRKIAKKMQEDLAGIDAALTVLRERREKNRDILKRSTEARAKRLDTVGALQQELVENSRTLVEAGDFARGAGMRILLRNDLYHVIKEAAGNQNLGPGAAQIEAMAGRIATMQTDFDSQFRRFPRRERKERPGERPGRLPRLPPIPGATDAPRQSQPPPAE